MSGGRGLVVGGIRGRVGCGRWGRVCKVRGGWNWEVGHEDNIELDCYFPSTQANSHFNYITLALFSIWTALSSTIDTFNWDIVECNCRIVHDNNL